MVQCSEILWIHSTVLMQSVLQKSSKRMTSFLFQPLRSYISLEYWERKGHSIREHSIETTMYFHRSKGQLFICLLVISLFSRASCSLWAIDMLSKSKMPLQSYSEENNQEEHCRKCYTIWVISFVLSELFSL